MVLTLRSFCLSSGNISAPYRVGRVVFNDMADHEPAQGTHNRRALISFEIEKMSIEAQMKLVGGHQSAAEAKSFLESMPTVEQLMPAISVAEVEVETRRRGRI